ncbi:2060_t:CDS:2, partial [Diversispora eburnea]
FFFAILFFTAFVNGSVIAGRDNGNVIAGRDNGNVIAGRDRRCTIDVDVLGFLCEKNGQN